MAWRGALVHGGGAGQGEQAVMNPATRFALIFAAQFAAFGVMMPFLPPLLLARGLTPADLGTVLAAGSALKLLAGPAGGRLADRLGDPRLVLICCTGAAALCAAGFGLAGGFWALLLVNLALAVALAVAGREVTLWARDADHVAAMAEGRSNAARLEGVMFPASLNVTDDLRDVANAKAVLLALPMQALAGFLGQHGNVLNGMPLVVCCKGIDLATLRGPTAIVRDFCPQSAVSILTGPSFAADIARGLPTALTLAGQGVEALQPLLSTATLRLYRSDDAVGAELGGALKNVVAIAAGVVMGAGLGESARAALITRGFAEMQRFALSQGAASDTMLGLSGLGDLILTCTSTQSRNLRYGMALGSGAAFDRTITVEGVATAQAIEQIAQNLALDMPVSTMVARLIRLDITLDQAIHSLMSRPLRKE